jgi:hypothetical protein
MLFTCGWACRVVALRRVLDDEHLGVYMVVVAECSLSGPSVQRSRDRTRERDLFGGVFDFAIRSYVGGIPGWQRREARCTRCLQVFWYRQYECKSRAICQFLLTWCSIRVHAAPESVRIKLVFDHQYTSAAAPLCPSFTGALASSEFHRLGPCALVVPLVHIHGCHWLLGRYIA